MYLHKDLYASPSIDRRDLMASYSFGKQKAGYDWGALRSPGAAHQYSYNEMQAQLSPETSKPVPSSARNGLFKHPSLCGSHSLHMLPRYHSARK